jgi:hypothetical protein
VANTSVRALPDEAVAALLVTVRTVSRFTEFWIRTDSRVPSDGLNWAKLSVPLTSVKVVGIGVLVGTTMNSAFAGAAYATRGARHKARPRTRAARRGILTTLLLVLAGSSTKEGRHRPFIPTDPGRRGTPRGLRISRPGIGRGERTRLRIRAEL